LSFTPLGAQIDKDAYDWIFRLYRPPDWSPQSILLAIDEPSLQVSGGMRGLRGAMAEGLEVIAKVGPKAVAIDAQLADAPEDSRDVGRVERVIRKTPNVVLAGDLAAGEGEEPLPRSGRYAAGKGHASAEPDPVCRKVMLEKAAGADRRWALALETYRAG